MDTVRFGRVLGQGARQAAKTLVSAVDAATAPNPAQPSARPANATTPAPAASPSVQPAAGPRPTAPPVPSPTSIPTILPPTTPRPPQPTRQNVAAPSPRPHSSASASPRGLAEGSRRFGRAVWAPAVRLSGVLWLELTGVFFALFALVAAIAAWHLRTALSTFPAASDDRTRLLFAAGMVLVFGYFSLSSFLKARHRSRRP